MGTKDLEVSIIVLGYNGRRFLSDCLQSVLGQDLPSGLVEVIYADNGSSDGSADFVREQFPQVRVLAFGRNLGYAQGNNMAFERARARYVVLLNQDAALHPGALRALRDAMATDDRLGACGTNTQLMWQEELPRKWEDALPDTARVSYLGKYGFGRVRRQPMQDEAILTRFVSGQCMMVDGLVVGKLDYLFGSLILHVR